MTENEFIKKLREIGYTNAMITDMINSINLMKNKGESVVYEELLPFAIDAYNKYKDFPDDLLSVD